MILIKRKARQIFANLLAGALRAVLHVGVVRAALRRRRRHIRGAILHHNMYGVWYVCMYVRMYVRICVYVRISCGSRACCATTPPPAPTRCDPTPYYVWYVCMYVRTYVSTYMYVRICMYVRISCASHHVRDCATTTP
jgi:hypothetical protein